MDTPLRLLFVEDLSSEVELTVRQFTGSGISCEWRRVDTELALREELARFRPHAVLSDFGLPGLDGWTALACVHALDPDLPFLFVSGTIGEEGAIEALRHGASDYVLKGNLARLVPGVQRALREVALRREQQRAVQQLRDIVDTSQDWIWELDAEQRVVFASSVVEPTLGHTPDEMLRTNFLEHVAAEQRDQVAGELAALSAGQRTARFQAQFLVCNGDRRWLESNVLALFGDDGQTVGIRGASRDVTERHQQQRRIQRLRRVLKMVGGVNSALVRVRDRDQLLAETCRIAVTVGGYVSAVVSLVEPGQVLRVATVAGIAAVSPDTRLPLAGLEPAELSISARAVLAQQPVVVRDIRDPGVAPISRALAHPTVQAVVALPLTVDRAVVGVLALCADEAGRLDSRELVLLRELAANLSFALQYLARQNAVHFLSYFDPLTGLANRALFCERFAQRLARRVGPEARPALVVLDLERLGVVNDSAGRQVGDGLLQRVAERLRGHVDDPECLAHLGAGVFAMVLPLLGASDHAFSLLHERISGLFVKPFEIEEHTIRAAARCGIACFPDDGQEPKALLENAEAALKSAKEAGETFLGYKLQMHRGRDRQLALEQRLRIAIEERQFELYYQPKVDIGSRRIVGLEALLRWNDPARGLVTPGEFLPVLEATHLINDVGDWVIAQALRDLQQWRIAGLPVRVAVNVSPWQLRRPQFAERLLAQLGTTFNGGRSGLDIEITEGALLQDPDDALRKLSLLRAAGVNVAIDDFGTGYSSLSRLSLLPVDTLKIDRSFISGLPADPAALALVSTIIALARAFSLATVAEGVETLEQLQVLRELGCQESQGYLHSRPQPIATTTALLHQDRAARGDFGGDADFNVTAVGRE